MTIKHRMCHNINWLGNECELTWHVNGWCFSHYFKCVPLSESRKRKEKCVNENRFILISAIFKYRCEHIMCEQREGGVKRLKSHCTQNINITHLSLSKVLTQFLFDCFFLNLQDEVTHFFHCTYTHCPEIMHFQSRIFTVILNMHKYIPLGYSQINMLWIIQKIFSKHNNKFWRP